MGSLKREEIEKIENELKDRKDASKKLRDLWKELAEDLKTFKAECPFCGGEYRLVGTRQVEILEGSVAEPEKTRVENRHRAVFQCYECGFVPEFDIDFFSSKRLEEAKTKEHKQIIEIVKEAIVGEETEKK